MGIPFVNSSSLRRFSSASFLRFSAFFASSAFHSIASGSEVLVASARTINHVIEAARLGAHVVTLPPKVLRDLALHPLTDKGLAGFLKDWEKSGQKIL